VPTALQGVGQASDAGGGDLRAGGDVAELLGQIETAAAGDAFQLYHDLHQTSRRRAKRQTARPG